MVSELTIAEQTDLWHHMASLNLREETKPNQSERYQTKCKKPTTHRTIHFF
jgi:hypothetical protein